MPFHKVSGIWYLVSRNIKYKIQNTKYCKAKGFTLIELLVVITILGILASLTLATFGGTQERSRDSRRKTDLDAIKKALELAKQDSTGSYYYPACNPTAASCTLSGSSTNPPLTPGAGTPYMQTVPTDPKTTTGYTYVPTPPNCTGSPTPTCTSYTLVTCLENSRDSQSDEAKGGTNNAICGTLKSYTVSP